MNAPIPHDGSCADLAVQSSVSALHIPGSHTFIPFQQFSISDASGLRNPADDNNNKSSVPVVSVVTAVSGLCPAIPVVSMNQQGQLTQSVVTPTIIPAVVTPIAVQTSVGLAPSTTMTMTSALNITSHLSMTAPPQQQNLANTPINLSSPQTNNAKTPAHAPNTSLNNTPSSGSKSSGNTGTPSGANCKSNSSKSSSSSSSQGANSEQTDDLVKPVFKDGELVLEVECGQNKAILYLSKLCQGSKGPCISFQSSWLTPNEFQFVSGRETAKDWKRSIRHHGKSLKLLLAKGILNVHPTMCDCDGCRQGATLTRKGEKRRIPNGERKPRKPSSNSSNASTDSHVAGAFRPVGSGTMATNLNASGSSQTKAEAKRQMGDKFKMADGTLQSPTKETGANTTTKSVVSMTTSQRPSSLNTSEHHSKPKVNGASTAPTSPSTASDLTPSSSTAPSASAAPHQAGASSAPSTPNKIPTFPTHLGLAATFPSPATSLFMLSPQMAHCLPAIPTSTPGVTSFADNVHPSFHGASSNVENLQMLSPNLPLSDQAHTPSGSESDHNAEGQHDTEHNSEGQHDTEHNSDGHNDMDEDTNNCSSEHDDDSSDANLDEDSEDESEDPNKTIDNPVPATDNPLPATDNPVPATEEKVSTKDECTSNQAPEHSVEKHVLKEERENHSPAENDKVTEDHAKVTESMEVTDLSVPKDRQPVAPETPSENANPRSSPSQPPAFTFASMSSGQPLSVATTNVKSEHIWVPPKLSPHNGDEHIYRALNHCPPSRSPSQRSHHQESNGKGDHSHSSAPSNRDSDKTHGVKRSPVSEHIHKFEKEQSQHHVKTEIPTAKGFHSIDRHLNHHGETPKKEPQESTKHGVSLEDKNSREREERHKQRVREERNRKDREREERRERDRREEKEAEKRKHEEKERREKSQSDNGKQDRSSATPVTPAMDPSRRPTGGVADAAAFSDYMRVLAAGHGHTFNMPATPSYMPSLFQLRPAETSLPSHLLHHLSAYGPQLSGLSKDPLLYQTAAGAVPNYSHASLAQLHPLLQRQYAQPTLADYQRSLAAASYPWASAYPYLIPDMAAASSSSVAAAVAAAVGAKRHSSEMEAAMELNAKRMRLENRPQEYSSPWEYFAAAAAASQQQHQQQQQQQQQRIAMAQAVPCGLESTNVDKTAEYLRKRYMEYGPQAAAYLSALPEYARQMYHCACADHRDDDIRMWNVEDVCKFLNSLEGCGVYADHFREQRVDGRILALLTTDHLVKTLGMKLGPAVLLAEAIAKKLQDISKMSNCDACRSIAMSQAMHPMALPL